ncbi:MAG: hypothetical protein IPK87_01645 [Planctomycetes bacterium]|nr:hypothetical protein [Planctomycetota bacterium]
MRYFLLSLAMMLAACTQQRAPSQQSPATDQAPANAPAAPPANAPANEPAADAGKEVHEEKSNGGWQVHSGGRTSGPFARDLKVLYLEGRFRYQARYLNEALKRDTRLRYQGYFFDAQEGWTQPASRHEDAAGRRVKPLVAPFSHDGRVLTKVDSFLALGYDVIILGDIDAGDARMRAEHWDWLEEYVRRGGGLILAAGQAHHPDAYPAIPSFAKLWPLTPVEDQPMPDGKQLRYCGLTAEGSSHSILSMNDDADRNAELWGAEVDGKYEPGQLHGFYWHASGEAREGTTVLARSVMPGGKVADGAPLMAVREHGKGRILWVGSDDTWLWREFVGDTYFMKFWRNAMAWAADAVVK